MKFGRKTMRGGKGIGTITAKNRYVKFNNNGKQKTFDKKFKEKMEEYKSKQLKW